MKKRKLHQKLIITIFYNNEEDKGYIGEIPYLEHFSAFGETPEEVLREVIKAKNAWLEATRANRKPIPLPGFRAVIYQVA